MMISFRSKIFDSSIEEDTEQFLGEDVAKWIASRLSGWNTSVVGEDWGWAVLAARPHFKYVIGVYDHDVDDVTDGGAKWVIRLFNERDRSGWLKKLFRYVPPKAHEEVVAEVVGLLRSSRDVSNIEVEALV